MSRIILFGFSHPSTERNNSRSALPVVIGVVCGIVGFDQAEEIAQHLGPETELVHKLIRIFVILLIRGVQAEVLVTEWLDRFVRKDGIESMYGHSPRPWRPERRARKESTTQRTSAVPRRSYARALRHRIPTGRACHTSKVRTNSSDGPCSVAGIRGGGTPCGSP